MTVHKSINKLYASVYSTIAKDHVEEVFSQTRCSILDSWDGKWLIIMRFHEELTSYDI